MGYEDESVAAGAAIDCPDCKSEVGMFSDDFRGGVAATCPKCTWFGDPFSFFMDTNGIEDPFAAIAALRAAKVKIPKACERANAVRSYHKHLESRKALRRFAELMSRRSITHISGQPLTVLGYPLQPHFHPHWWCTTLDEARGILGNHVVSSDGHGWADAKPVVETHDTPAVMIPFYDVFGWVTGFVFAGDAGFAKYHGHGCPHGVAFTNYGNRWSPRELSDTQFWLTNPYTAVAMASGSMRDSSLLMHMNLFADDSAGTRKTLRLGRLFDEKAVIVSSHLAPEVIRLARKTGARIYVDGTGGSEAYVSPAAWLAGRVIPNACDWVRALEIGVSAGSDFSARGLLQEIGWNAKTVEKIRPQWRPTNLERAEKLMTNTSWRDLELHDKLTLCDTPEGLMNTVNGELLYEVVPSVDKVYRGDDGRVRYAGRLKLRGSEYRFDSPQFMRHPVAVIDSALLKNGIDPPRPHPILGPYLANYAGWLGGRE